MQLLRQIGDSVEQIFIAIQQLKESGRIKQHPNSLANNQIADVNGCDFGDSVDEGVQNHRQIIRGVGNRSPDARIRVMKQIKPSLMLEESRAKIIQEIKIVLEQNKAVVEDQTQIDSLTESFVDQVMGSCGPQHSRAAKVSQGIQTSDPKDEWKMGQLSCFAKLETLKKTLDDRILKLDTVLRDAAAQISNMIQCEHTFKNQLQAMIQFSSATEHDIKTNTDRVQEMLQQQVFAQQMMENLINDLLDLAKMKNNKFELHPSYFNLLATVRNCFQILLPSSQQQRIKFSLDVEHLQDLDFVQCFHGDERRFMQILLNFLSNSLKFSKPGSTVRVIMAVLGCQQVRPSSSSIPEIAASDQSQIG